MAGYVKSFVGLEYKGDFKLSGATPIKKGGFVVADYANSEFDIPAGDATGKLHFVDNEVVYEIPHGVDDKDFAVAGGEYVKAKPVLDGEIFVTDMITSTYAGIAKGAEMGVGANGKLALIADLTAGDFTGFATTFIVQEKVKLMGADALVVVAKIK